MTVTVDALALLRSTVSVTGVVPLLPSVTDDVVVENCTVGAASLSRIVPMPCVFAIVAFDGLVRSTMNVSVGSVLGSSVVLTWNVCVVTPGAKLSVPLVPL